MSASASPSVSHRGRRLAAIGIVGVLAAVGQYLLFRAEATIDRAAGQVTGWPPRREDYAELWHAGRAILSWTSSYPWYGDGHLLGYAPPYAVLMSPLSMSPYDLAIGASMLLSLALAAVLLWGWSRSVRPVPAGVVALLSFPVVNVVRLGQLPTVMGVVFLSLAVFAQRRDRWALAGVALALGAIRTPNAVPVVAMLVVGGWGRWRELGIMAAAAAAVLLPLVLIAFAGHPNWVGDWLTNLATDQQVGLQRALKSAYGLAGVAGLELAGLIAGMALGWRSRGRPLDLDDAALTLAVGVLLTHLSGPYVGVFILPVVIRLAMRPRLPMAAWVVAVVPWVVVLGLSGLLLGPVPEPTVGVLTTMVLMMLVAVIPLVRRTSPTPA